jgi:Tfp pilus assembly PilM family ATPase
MFKTKADTALAIDLAVDAVRVLDVKLRRGTPAISAFASQSVTPPSSGAGLDTLPERHLAALESLLATHRLKTRRCVVAMPTAMVVTRAVAIDNSKPQPADEQVRWTLQNCLPFDPKDLIFDFWPVNEPAANARTREVLVVATQASVVQRYLAGFEKLKLTCIHLDVAPCAIASLLARTVTGEGMVGTVALGETSGYFAIVEAQKALFWRPFELPSGPKAAANVGLDRIGDEISKCVSHMVGTMHGGGVNPLNELLVFGHGSSDAGFTDYLKNRFHLNVHAPSPFDSLPEESMPSELRNAVSPDVATHFAAAIGLAMQSAAGVTIHG